MSIILRLKGLTRISSQLKCLEHRLSLNISSQPGRQYASMGKVGIASSTSAEKQRKLMLDDNIPADYELIYRAPAENYIAYTKHGSTISATLVCLLAGYQLAYDMNYVSTEVDFAGLVADKQDLWWFGAGFLAINIAIRAFIAKYPLRIYKNDKRYIAVYSSQIPMKPAHHHFNKHEVTKVSNFLNPWSHIMYRLGNKNSLLLVDFFRTPSEFHQLTAPKEPGS